MDDNITLVLIILILASAILIGLTVNVVYGETEQECTKFRSNELIKLEVRGTYAIGGCDWLVGKVLGNNSEFKFADHTQFYNDGIGTTIETWVLTK